jgi:hypothetical protein
MMIALIRTVLAILAFALVGCASTVAKSRAPGTPGAPVVEFPSRGEVESLSVRPIELPKQLPTVEVARWQISTPIPAPGAPYSLETFWDRLLGAQISGSTLGAQPAASGTRASSELRCAAVENARFFVEHGAFPSEALQSYLALRCGSTVTRPVLGAVQAVVPDAVTPGRLETDLEPTVKSLLQQATFEAIDLREAKWLGEPLGPQTLDVEIGVTHYKPKGAAWGQYAVLVIVHPTQSG